MSDARRDVLTAVALMTVAVAVQIFIIPSHDRLDSWDFQELWILLAAGVVGWLGARRRRSQLLTAVGAATVPTLAAALAPLALPSGFQNAFYPALITVNALVTFLSSFGAAVLGAAIGSPTPQE